MYVYIFQFSSLFVIVFLTTLYYNEYRDINHLEFAYLLSLTLLAGRSAGDGSDSNGSLLPA